MAKKAVGSIKGKTTTDKLGNKSRAGTLPSGKPYASYKTKGDQNTWVGKKDGPYAGVHKESKKVAGKKTSTKGKFL
jgi:hypothetical protein